MKGEGYIMGRIFNAVESLICYPQAEMEDVQNTVSEIRKLTPELIQAAEAAAQSGAVEPLRLVAYEWATKVGLIIVVNM